MALAERKEDGTLAIADSEVRERANQMVHDVVAHQALDPADRLRYLQALAEMVDAALVREVRLAKGRDGLTWQQIADALGISRQAAHERFSRYLD